MPEGCDNAPRRSLLLENVGHGAGEAGHDVATVERLGPSQDLLGAVAGGHPAAHQLGFVAEPMLYQPVEYPV